LSRRLWWLAALYLLACRNGASGPPLDGGADLQQPLPMCTRAADCLACCTANFGSGALDYDFQLMSCACTATSCLSACSATVCGTSTGVDRACLACLDGALADGGVCQATAGDCLANAGPCAGFADCIAACPR
jgi:hypothetical protein